MGFFDWLTQDRGPVTSISHFLNTPFRVVANALRVPDDVVDFHDNLLPASVLDVATLGAEGAALKLAKGSAKVANGLIDTTSLAPLLADDWTEITQDRDNKKAAPPPPDDSALTPQEPKHTVLKRTITEHKAATVETSYTGVAIAGLAVAAYLILSN